MNRRFTGFSAGLFLAVCVAGFLLWAVPAVQERPLAAVAAKSTLASLLDGSTTAEIDETVERTHGAHEPARRMVTALRLLLFREGTGAVVPGSRGYLFTREEFEHHREDDAVLAANLHEMARVHGVLAERGLELLVVMVPSKARILSEYVPRHLQELPHHRRLHSAVEFLNNRGIAVVDPTEALATTEEQTFLRADTHWTPEGARIVAARTAEVAERWGFLDAADTQVFDLHRGEPQVHTGDLAVFVPLPDSLRFLAPVSEKVAVWVAEPRNGGGGLFDLPEIPVVLVGTSFSASPLWSFSEFLKDALHADLVNMAQEGVGPFAPMQDFLRDGPPEGVYPRVVVWEIPERYLTLPGNS